MDKMRIAIIIPYLHKIEGNKTALLLASQLMKEGNDVSLIIWDNNCNSHLVHLRVFKI